MVTSRKKVTTKKFYLRFVEESYNYWVGLTHTHCGNLASSQSPLGFHIDELPTNEQITYRKVYLTQSADTGCTSIDISYDSICITAWH